jgi:hypothetical protein
MLGTADKEDVTSMVCTSECVDMPKPARQFPPGEFQGAHDASRQASYHAMTKPANTTRRTLLFAPCAYNLAETSRMARSSPGLSLERGRHLLAAAPRSKVLRDKRSPPQRATGPYLIGWRKTKRWRSGSSLSSLLRFIERSSLRSMSEPVVSVCVLVVYTTAPRRNDDEAVMTPGSDTHLRQWNGPKNAAEAIRQRYEKGDVA